MRSTRPLGRVESLTSAAGEGKNQPADGGDVADGQAGVAQALAGLVDAVAGDVGDLDAVVGGHRDVGTAGEAGAGLRGDGEDLVGGGVAVEFALDFGDGEAGVLQQGAGVVEGEAHDVRHLHRRLPAGQAQHHR